MYPRILTIQDISCVGQCSMTVALPVLSACGVETCVLPSAVLPTNSGLLQGYLQADLTEHFLPICEHWQKMGIDFDGIYTGYLGTIRQIDLVNTLCDRVLKSGGKRIVDPAMADHGRLYSGLDSAYGEKMQDLCRRADVLLPNLAESCMLTGTPWKERFCRQEIRAMLEQLGKTYAPGIVLTGVSFQPGETGIAVWDGEEIRTWFHPRIPGSYHGTGDIFASVFTGAWLRGKPLFEAAVLAERFTAACIAETRKQPAHAYGVRFEPVLPRLGEWLEAACPETI